MALIGKARSLRKRLTAQEVKLWKRLREWREFGFHFRRQAPVGPYIVDFVCFGSRLIVEADGGQHMDARHVQADEARDRFFESQGFCVLRFWNSEIEKNLNGVLEVVRRRLDNPHPGRHSPADPPHKGEGGAHFDHP